MMPHNPIAYVLPALLLIAAVSDVRAYRIPNWLTLATALLFFPVAWWMGMPWADYITHLMAGALLFFIGFLMFQFNIFGGGDAKLMAAAGLWFGMANLPVFITWTAFAGGVLAIGVGLWSAWMMSTEIQGEAAALASIWKRLRVLRPNLPYGVAIAVGGLFAFHDTGWLSGVVAVSQ
jgi:prepilin peptidase CpaA